VSQLASLFEAPGGARRVTLTEGMSALLDEGENHVTLLWGRLVGAYQDLLLVVAISALAPEAALDPPSEPSAIERDAGDTAPAPGLTPCSREWFVALALAEPWLSGADDHPRPPSNREIYERVLAWNGYAWKLERPQRVDDAIRAVAGVAFGPRDDPFRSGATGRVQNIRYAVGRRSRRSGWSPPRIWSRCCAARTSVAADRSTDPRFCHGNEPHPGSFSFLGSKRDNVSGTGASHRPFAHQGLARRPRRDPGHLLPDDLRAAARGSADTDRLRA
jgi:hypothetical protein